MTRMTTFHVNRRRVAVDADPETPLLWVLRDTLKLTGTKYGCGLALCGACTVHLDGQAVRACQTPLAAVAGKKITTIEGLTGGLATAIHQAWVSNDVPQCGYCQPGQIMEAAALLQKRPNPTDGEIESVMSGHICRCGTYNRIRAAIKEASRSRGGRS
jgi:isoquinoline 1-oxidoreductase alpha subunit